MCGIVGYVGKETAAPLLIACAKNLEYRGYDSFGVAVYDGSQVNLCKDVGQIASVEKKTSMKSLVGNIGIAHTRWATNGTVTKTNSHPHLSFDQKVYLVHNGIIENYQTLRTLLATYNIACSTETDSEVIAHLLAYHAQKTNSFLEALRTTLEVIEGSYALAILYNDDKRLYFARKDSPLVIGKSDSGFFIASDVPAFLHYAREVLFIEDGEYGYIGEVPKTYMAGKEVDKKYQHITWDVEQAKKGAYPHFMLKEIEEQQQTVLLSLKQDQNILDKAVSLLQHAYGTFFVGCGTSYHAGVTASYLFSHIAQKHVNTVIASEFRHYHDFLTDKTVMVALSQSGETADLIDAVKVAKSKGVKVIAIVNVMGSTLMRLSDVSILMHAGPEICVLSTKSYTSQLAILTTLAYALAGSPLEGKKLIEQTSKEIERLVQNVNDTDIEAIAEEIHTASSMFLIGRDLAYPSALEGALKIKEVSYIHAEGFPGGELKHGTIALIEQGTPCIVFVTEDTMQSINSNAAEIKARGGKIIGIGAHYNDIYDYFIKTEEMGYGNPLHMIVPVQLLAYHLAIKRGCDPDKPRNLAKSVTVR